MGRVTLLVLAVVLMVVATEALLKLPSTTTTKASCRYWCKKLSGRAYCCDEEVDDAGEKRGICPPVREFCPQSFHHSSRPPPRCTRDRECQGKEKCCYDVCLEHRTCKPAQEPVVPLGNHRN